MAIDMEAEGQMSLLQFMDWRTTITLPQNHQLIVLCNSIPWMNLIEKSVPILYDEQGISKTIGPKLNLRAHLGAYILQTVHGWTDRWTEEMIRYYIPARIFCGFSEDSGSLDHTRIEDFRNRFGEKGAQLITTDMIHVTKNFGFTDSEDLDMDTTVQEAGITHPTEMKLLDHLLKKSKKIHEKLKELGHQGLRGMKKTLKTFTSFYTEYRFFAKTKEKKSEIIEKSVELAHKVLGEMQGLKESSKRLEGLWPSMRTDAQLLQELGPKLLKQIKYWLRTGNVASNKIVSLWKKAPKAISKGKIGKPVEFGRKWIVNAYRGGYVLLTAPNKVKLSDQHCVVESLNLHFDVWNESPKSYGADRGMWSETNVMHCLSADIEKVALQPKGGVRPLVNQQDHQELKNRRAGIEPRIGHLKNRGLGRSRMKNDTGDLIAGYRSALSNNLANLMRDLAIQAMN